jgi:integrase
MRMERTQKVVQELLRHASLKVTTDVYMQAVSPQKREAQSKLVKMVMKKTASS